MDDSDLLAPVLTKAALYKRDKDAKFKAKVFEMPRLLPRSESTVQQLGNHKNLSGDQGVKVQEKVNEGPEFDIKRARHEVFNFGVSGFKSKNKRKAQIALAVKLGAKPSKKAGRNYKEILAEKKRTQAIREEKLELKRLGKNQVGAPIIKYRKPKIQKKGNKVGELSTHYGVVNPKIKKKK